MGDSSDLPILEKLSSHSDSRIRKVAKNWHKELTKKLNKQLAKANK
jgi:hypothetical protein